MARKQRRRKPSSNPLVLLVIVVVIALMLSPEARTGALILAGAAGTVLLVKSVFFRSARLENIEHFEQVLDLTPTQFEEYTRQLLLDLGYKNMRLTGGPGDLGADLLGRDPRGRSIIVQCKRYAPTKKIGSKEIQTFIGMQQIHHRVDGGIFVTTSDFTAAARDLANLHGIWLINGAALMNLQHGGGNAAASKRSWIGAVVGYQR